MELDRRGAELLFQVLTEREETNSIAIASNESFSGWTKTVTDPRLCAAIVDRLTFGGNIIETGTSSHRLAHARAQRSRPADRSAAQCSLVQQRPHIQASPDLWRRAVDSGSDTQPGGACVSHKSLHGRSLRTGVDPVVNEDYTVMSTQQAPTHRQAEPAVPVIGWCRAGQQRIFSVIGLAALTNQREPDVERDGG